MLTFYASAAAEASAVRRAAARAGCSLRSLELEQRPHGPRLVGSLSCADGWTAAKLLLALADEDAATIGARQVAQALRLVAPDDVSFAHAVHRFVRGRVRFAREEGEILQSGAFTLQEGFGDCDDHFRLSYALAVAGGLTAKLGLLHHGLNVPVDMQGPAHAAPILCPKGVCSWAETTVAARYGEAPNDAARRLGLTNARSDIAREVVIMSASDLPPVPPGFRDRNDPAQVRVDVEALQRLGYLSPDVATDDAADPVLRQAVLAFQVARGFSGGDLDGNLGPQTRGELARAMTDAGVEGFAIGELGAVAVKESKHISAAFLRGVHAMAARFRALGATATDDDWLLVWLAESDIRNIPNRQGAPFGGVNQMGPQERKNAGFTGTFADWLALSLEAQLPFVERYYIAAAQGHAERFRDGPSLYLANFAPAFMAHAAEPDFVIFRRDPASPAPSAPDAEWKEWREAHRNDPYAWNRGFDRRRDGTIRVGDLRVALEGARSQRASYFKEVVARMAEASGGLEGVGGAVAGVVVVLGILGTIAGAAYAHGAFT